MRIDEVHITPVAVADPPLLNAAGLHAPYALRIVLELVSADGISGWGEIPGSEATRAALAQAAERIIGADPWQLNSIAATLDALAGADARGDSPWDQRSWVQVRSAIEVACYDLMGKSCGRTVVDLLGGAARERVPFAAYLFYKQAGAGGEFGFERDSGASGWFAARQNAALDADGVVAQARAMIARYGFKSIKLKGGVFPPQVEVYTMLALRDAFGPDMPLRLDPNAIWRVSTAIAAGRQLEQVLEYYEDPVRGQRNMSAVAKALNIPLATNMCTTSFDDLPGSLRHNSEAIILSDHHFWDVFQRRNFVFDLARSLIIAPSLGIIDLVRGASHNQVDARGMAPRAHFGGGCRAIADAPDDDLFPFVQRVDERQDIVFVGPDLDADKMRRIAQQTDDHVAVARPPIIVQEARALSIRMCFGKRHQGLVQAGWTIGAAKRHD